MLTNNSVADMWDKKFSSHDYMYTKEVNKFLKSYIDTLSEPSKILFLGEGEGRNAVYAARNNHMVSSLDASRVGVEKTKKLAQEYNVSVNTICADLEVHKLEGKYSYIMSSYMHLPEPLRTKAFQESMDALDSEGFFIGEFFSHNQMDRNSGGPKSLELLYTLESLSSIFSQHKIVMLEEIVVDLDEGKHHSGEADVIRIIVQKVSK